MSLLDPEDLAYMRETQAGVRPTEAVLYALQGRTRDGMGGWTDGWPDADDGHPVQVRIVRVNDNTAGDEIPQDVANRYQVTDLRKVVCDLVSIPPGSLLHDTDSGTWYEVVTEGRPEAWTTALIVWATPTTKRPPA